MPDLSLGRPHIIQDSFTGFLNQILLTLGFEFSVKSCRQVKTQAIASAILKSEDLLSNFHFMFETFESEIKVQSGKEICLQYV